MIESFVLRFTDPDLYAESVRNTAVKGSGSDRQHTGRYGGTASGNGSSWSGHTAFGGSASGGGSSWHANGAEGGTASGGGGSWHANSAYGGSASGGGGSWSATNRYGSTASGGYNHYYGSYYGGYHPPAVVNSYSTGCYNCGGWSTGGALAAGAVGVAAGAAIGASVANANAAAATSNAYAAGVAAGATRRPPTRSVRFIRACLRGVPTTRSAGPHTITARASGSVRRMARTESITGLCRCREPYIKRSLLPGRQKPGPYASGWIKIA